MVTDYRFEKAKIPKGLSYPLKRSRLDKALIEFSINHIHFVYYCIKKPGCNITLQGDYCGEQRKGWYAAGMSSIHLYATPSEYRHEVAEAIEIEFLPKLMQWLSKIEQAGNTYRFVDHHFIGSWNAGQTSIKTT